MNRSEPPRFFTTLLRRVADPDSREAQLGDLAEEFGERAEVEARAAARWYRRQVLGSVGPNLKRRTGRVLRSALNGWTGDGTMGSLLNELRITLRSFTRHAPFHAVIILTLGLGIGAIATTFSVAYGLILNPFPFPEPDRIIGVGTAYPRLGVGLGFMENMSPAEFEDIRDNTRTLEDVVAWDMGNRQIDTEGPPENVFSAFWWGDALRTVQMDAHLGRGFTDDEIETGARVVLLSETIWTSRFGADSSMIGGTVSVNGDPYTLVGVFPRGVNIYATDLWMVMPVGPEVFPRNRRQFQVMARVTESSSLDEVNTELATIANQTATSFATEFEEYEGWSMTAMTWNNVSSQFFRTGVLVLMGAVTFVLLLVCANAANLLLARARGRRREMAVRTALGAGRARLVGQLLTESLAMAAMGGVVGVLVAYLGVRGVGSLFGAVGFGFAGTIELNLPVLAFTAAVAMGCGILFGLAPAVQASGSHISSTLQSEGKATTATASRQRLQRSLVGIEVALAFVLLAGGGLLLNSFIRVSNVDPGFDASGVLTMRLTLPPQKYEGQEVPAFFRALNERLEAIPGVQSAGAGTQFPPVAFAFSQIFFEGGDQDPEATLPTTLTTVVTEGYFEALGIPLLRGRTFNTLDGSESPRVAVINQRTAERYFPGEDPIGRTLRVGSADPSVPAFEIVGVVGATTNLGLDQDPFPEVFALHEQIPGQNQLFLVLRTEGDPSGHVEAVRQAVLEMDADQPVYAIRTVSETFDAGIAPIRATTLFLTLFGAFAIVLAAVGIYAVVSYTVGERTQEIGLRVALGADQGRVRRLVVREALLPVLIGAVVGSVAAVFLGGRLEQILFEVAGNDPLTMVAAALLLIGVAVVASWVPAFRAARLDPVEALRSD